MLKFLKKITKKFIFRNKSEHKLIVFDCVNDKYFRELFQIPIIIHYLLDSKE